MMNAAMNATQRRMHWRCRRGMLELDLLFQDFTEHHLRRLDNAQIAALDALLDLPDNELWDLVTNAVPSENAVSQQVLTWLRTTRGDRKIGYTT
jgi:antitoxin CptB